MTKYVCISIPEQITQMIDKKYPVYGYSSRADFVKQAIRHELERLSVVQEYQ